MKKILSLLAILLFSLTGFSQTIIMQDSNPMAPYEVKTQGPNLKNYGQWFIGFGAVTPVGAASDNTIFGKSLLFDLGYRYRYRVSNFFNTGFDLSYYLQGNRLNKSGMLKVYDGLVHGRENIIQNEFRLSPFLRFNLTPKRGNFLGTYVDLGGYVAWNFLPVFRAVDTRTSNNEMLKYTRQFDPMQKRYEYGLTGRIGRNKLIVFAHYRLSDLLKNSSLPDLPRLAAGVQFGL